MGKVDLNRMLVKNPLATFLVRCTGTAMTAAGIEFGDVCIVDRSLDARSGDIVLAYINARFTMRRYEEYGEDGRRLVPVAKEGVHPVTEITDKGCTVKNVKTGEKFFVECDNVVNGIGFVPTPVGGKDLSRKVKGKETIFRVGDCVAIGNLRTVIWRAWDVCMKI